jgi:hypothetical protein
MALFMAELGNGNSIITIAPADPWSGLQKLPLDMNITSLKSDSVN